MYLFIYLLYLNYVEVSNALRLLAQQKIKGTSHSSHKVVVLASVKSIRYRRKSAATAGRQIVVYNTGQS